MKLLPLNQAANKLKTIQIMYIHNNGEIPKVEGHSKEQDYKWKAKTTVLFGTFYCQMTDPLKPGHQNFEKMCNPKPRL